MGKLRHMELDVLKLPPGGRILIVSRSYIRQPLECRRAPFQYVKKASPTDWLLLRTTGSRFHAYGEDPLLRFISYLIVASSGSSTSLPRNLEILTVRSKGPMRGQAIQPMNPL
jgi:hypothetical protein